MIFSRERLLTVQAPATLDSLVPRLSPHLPGVGPNGIVMATTQKCDAVIQNGTCASDVRRLLNAHLHQLHLHQSTLCVHAVTLHHDDLDATVMLLGGHGAGKTLVSLALTQRGWHTTAGDVTLLDCYQHAAVVSGGTRAVIARRDAVHRWFPHLVPPQHEAVKMNLQTLPAVGLDQSSMRALKAAVVVNVDGDPHGDGAAIEEMDHHTAVTTWLRSSSHLLDRVLQGSDIMLRRFESASASRQRLLHVRALATHTPLHAARGTPQKIALQVEYLAAHSNSPSHSSGDRCYP